jgi:hypothetical protein
MQDADDPETRHLVEELQAAARELRTVTDEVLAGSEITTERGSRMDRAMWRVEDAQRRLSEHLFGPPTS